MDTTVSFFKADDILTPILENHELSQREDADDAIAYAWVVGTPKAVKREPEDADDAVAYAWVVGQPKI